MKYGFEEALDRKTARELDTISKDAVFYSEEERLLALDELERRGDLTPEFSNLRDEIDPEWKLYPVSDVAPTMRIYNKRMMYVAIFLGGPLVAGYMMAANFKAFGKAGHAKRALVFDVLTTIIIYAALYFTSEYVLDNIPKFLIPCVYTGIAYLLIHIYQAHDIGVHEVSGGPLFSWGRAIAVGLICAAIFLV